MSSYFDNQYGSEVPDDDFKGGDSDNESSSSDTTGLEEIEEEEEEEQDGVEDDGEQEEDVEDVEDDENDDEDDDEDDEGGQQGGAESELEEEIEQSVEKNAKKIKKVPAKNVYKKPIDFVDDDDDDDDDGEQYLQKFDQSVNDNYILNFHPESVLQNYDEILSMTKVVRNSDGVIVDKLHRTIPYLTKYEKARILGQRAKQINSGAYPFVKVPENVIDGYIIAEIELKQKRIPFIIRRPLPNGGSEYWRVQDLEDISF
jgi:DNA-directed RNA polymerase I, II, and III subunit RPABC2